MYLGRDVCRHTPGGVCNAHAMQLCYPQGAQAGGGARRGELPICSAGNFMLLTFCGEIAFCCEMVGWWWWCGDVNGMVTRAGGGVYGGTWVRMYTPLVDYLKEARTTLLFFVWGFAQCATMC